VTETLRLSGAPYASVRKVQDLRYGETRISCGILSRRHSTRGASPLYADSGQGAVVQQSRCRRAWECVKTFDQPACVIVKTPILAVPRSELTPRSVRARLATTPRSIRGIVLSTTTRRCDAGAVSKHFVEVVIAPEFDAGARQILAAKTTSG